MTINPFIAGALGAILAPIVWPVFKIGVFIIGLVVLALVILTQVEITDESELEDNSDHAGSNH